ncbi:MAG: aromatic ring-hydroxylating dioxygenase subunit alpha [Betaproteobacteria bacterium]|nr:aromatic ring-hydroxylating dioxygenase subunit alpha [Betaproteobacteria bacterium]
MLSVLDNENMSRVSAGTPAGELLRRYWHPVAPATAVNDENPILKVRLLGEDLVLFQMKLMEGETDIRYGLVGESCPHRLVSLSFGRADAHGIRCPYHGWKFDSTGQCIEQPAEPKESTYKNRIKHIAYPVQKLGGLLFAYLGPLPAPLLPNWDVLAREDGKRWGVVESVMNCNWLQPMENSVDPAHLYWLHGNMGSIKSDAEQARFDALGVQAQYNEKNDFVLFDYGIQKVRITYGKKPDDAPLSEQHPLVFPTMLRLVLGLDLVIMQGYDVVKTFGPDDLKLKYMHNMQFRVPVDDTHTQVIHVNFMPSETVRTSKLDDIPFENCNLKTKDGQYNFRIVTAQDAMAWETQGSLTDRSREHLGTSDRGILILRKLLKEQIEIVARGGEPIGVLRNPDKNRIIDLDVYHEPFGLQRKNCID